MVAKYTMKLNGKWYLAGDEIADETKEAVEEAASDAKNICEVKNESKKLTKTDINRMSTDGLKALAAKNEVQGYAGMTGMQLKELFIKLLDL